MALSASQIVIPKISFRIDPLFATSSTASLKEMAEANQKLQEENTKLQSG